MSAGLLTTCTPAAVSAAIFSAAVPLPPAMIAPACPIRRPGGAVCPGDEADDRLLELRLDEGRRLLFRRPADLADHHDRFGRASPANSASASMKLVPISGSPPMPMQVVWPRPSLVS